MKALQEIPKGHALSINYQSNKGMMFYFQAYGFVSHPSEFDSFDIVLKLREEFPEYEAKLELLKNNKENNFRVIGNLNFLQLFNNFLQLLVQLYLIVQGSHTSL